MMTTIAGGDHSRFRAVLEGEQFYDLSTNFFASIYIFYNYLIILSNFIICMEGRCYILCTTAK